MNRRINAAIGAKDTDITGYFLDPADVARTRMLGAAEITGGAKHTIFERFAPSAATTAGC